MIKLEMEGNPFDLQDQVYQEVNSGTDLAQLQDQSLVEKVNKIAELAESIKVEEDKNIQLQKVLDIARVSVACLRQHGLPRKASRPLVTPAQQLSNWYHETIGGLQNLPPRKSMPFGEKLWAFLFLLILLIGMVCLGVLTHPVTPR